MIPNIDPNNQTNHGGKEPNLTEQELRSKLKEYINFIDNILQPELVRAVSEREKVEFEIEEYNELKVHVQMFIQKKRRRRRSGTKSGAHHDDVGGDVDHSQTMNDDDNDAGNDGDDDEQIQMSMVDISGCQMAYCPAKITNPNKIFVDITGEGTHTEMTLEEAIVAIEKRIQLLEDQVLPKRVEKAKTVAGHIEQSLSLLESLGKEVHMQTSEAEQ